MIPLVKVSMPPKDELLPALEKILYSGMIAEGEAVYEFESSFAKHFGLSNILAMSSGTAALHTALILSGVGLGDEVISTPMTAEPTNLAILHCGAKVVWADVDPNTGNIDPQSVRKQITPKTKAILCVHYAGYPVRLLELRKIADEFGISLIEDCAHALGAKYNGKSVGQIGDYAIFSFQAIKHMTSIDGGVLVLKSPLQMEEAKKIRWFGMLKGVPRTEIDVTRVGYKYNMNNVTAVIGIKQLENINQILNRYIENGKYFDSALSGIQGIDFAKCDSMGEPSYWLYTLLSDNSKDIERVLNSSAIAASKLHRPNNLHGIFKDSQRDLSGLKKFYDRLLHIPSGWWVSDEDRYHIIETLCKG